MGGNVVTMTPQPLPCPFCGSTDVTIELDTGVLCSTCTATGPLPASDSENELEIIRKWNERVEPPIAVGGEIGASWADLLESAGRVKPWRSGDARCHCTHCSGCGEIFPTASIGVHQPACVQLAREMFEMRTAIVKLMQDKRHHGSCVREHTHDDYAYLKDGTKVVVKRKGQAAWLEVLPQAVLKPS